MQPQRPNITTVDEDLTLRYVVQPREQLQDTTLATAVGADDDAERTAVDLEGYFAQRPRVRFWVLERDVPAKRPVKPDVKFEDA